MKILSVVGARPQLVKAAVVSRSLEAAGHEERLVHTGQHYDHMMSKVFFDELGLPEPDLNLEVGSGSHGFQTGAMLSGLDRVMAQERPDWVLVYGDTNSTLAGALAAAKLHLKLAHVEAGLRSFDRSMPEEINRVVTDHVSNLLLCPSEAAVKNLKREGIEAGVDLVGDVMADVLSWALARAGRASTVDGLELEDKAYLLATVHRAENTDRPSRLRAILAALEGAGERVIFPVHPRTRTVIEEMGYEPVGRVELIEPVGYLDMVRLEQGARMIVTDSGGIQKEAYWLGVPCITLRDETEWVETVEMGWNVLVGSDTAKVAGEIRGFAPPAERPDLYGDGQASARIVEILGRAGSPP